jgi:hypothetical protein
LLLLLLLLLLLRRSITHCCEVPLPSHQPLAGHRPLHLTITLQTDDVA